MVRILALVTLLLVVGGGCTWQANNAGEAVTINPFAAGSGQVISPANDRYYMNGEPMDMRNR
jgi:hypothetical protein